MDIIDTLKTVKSASGELLALSVSQINDALLAVADAIDRSSDAILASNATDLARMSADNPLSDRLKLTPGRIADITADIRNVASLPSPLVEIEHRTLPNGLQLSKQAVPFGVIGVIYEARPNVTPDVASLCLKSGNACVLKGGHDAQSTNEVMVSVIRKELGRCGISPDVVTLLPPDREATSTLLAARGYVDLIIPRGSRRLIDFVRETAKVPVIETGAGVCHVYFDASGDVAKGARIITNAKTRRVSVCNALDCVLIHNTRLPALPELCAGLVEKNVVIFADAPAKEALSGYYPAALLKDASDESFGTEFLDYKMAVRTVDSPSEAIGHIAHYGSGHSDAIVTEDDDVARLFILMVDSACVYLNAPTSFTDGAQFGLGAEIGISTQKLHARGPMALREMTTYKWIIKGNGQVRP